MQRALRTTPIYYHRRREALDALTYERLNENGNKQEEHSAEPEKLKG